MSETALRSYPSITLDVQATSSGLTLREAGGTTVTEAGKLTVEEFSGYWTSPAGEQNSCNTIEWGKRTVIVRTSLLNPTKIYYWASPDSDRFLVGTDRISLLACVIEYTGLRAVRTLRTIGAGRTVTFSWKGSGERIDVDDIMTARWTPSPRAGETALEAGNRQIAALRNEIAAVVGPGPITVVVSGGVDSGLVAALAQQVGRVDHLASLGTPWGDEYTAADELGEHLGIPVQRIALSEDEILRALPETVRMLGTTDRELVAAGVSLVAVYRQGTIPVGTILTGVGADLINSGSRVGSAPIADMRKAVVEQLLEVASSAELTGVGAAVHGYTLRHMYWNFPVVQAALDTSPEIMRHAGREKGHMRVAAQQLLPDRIAWRAKQALHHGSGVDQNLDSAIAELIGIECSKVERFYELIEAHLVEAHLESPDNAIQSDECLEAAISAYRAEKA